MRDVYHHGEKSGWGMTILIILTVVLMIALVAQCDAYLGRPIVYIYDRGVIDGIEQPKRCVLEERGRRVDCEKSGYTPEQIATFETHEI